ncbi:hypothetical protein [Gordonia sp. (in: high G+C Gram-positive bacteria)]|uniref:hypothetical protein n=1 Tax=Gordonia sp. (in: high G+C Gram-positive bacteria) TaxID=84139 RepID=UPI0039E2BE80
MTDDTEWMDPPPVAYCARDLIELAGEIERVRDRISGHVENSIRRGEVDDDARLSVREHTRSVARSLSAVVRFLDTEADYLDHLARGAGHLGGDGQWRPDDAARGAAHPVVEDARLTRQMTTN